jgi:hypothetical protein
MKIFGKSLSEYVSFEKGFLILILVVGFARLGLSLAACFRSDDPNRGRRGGVRRWRFPGRRYDTGCAARSYLTLRLTPFRTRA